MGEKLSIQFDLLIAEPVLNKLGHVKMELFAWRLFLTGSNK